MPSDLSTPRTDVRRANLESARRLDPFTTIEIRPPFVGYIPDIDPNALPGTALVNTVNVQASPLPPGTTGGEYLISSPGYTQVDPTRLPLKDDNNGVGVPSGVAAPIVSFGQLNRTTTTGARDSASGFDVTPMALVSNTGTGAAVPWRINPATGQWIHIEAAGTPMVVNRDGTAGYTKGMPHLTAYQSGMAGNRQPIMVFCNTTDNVMYWPNAGGTYEVLDGASSAVVPLFTNFRARSGTSWNGRFYFLNTYEDTGGTIAITRNRVRRTAINDAGDFTSPGAGARDIRQFHRDGVRLEPLGDLLAVYFEDGVAFLHPTTVATAPDELEIVTKKRGLIATHAIDNVGADVHFGIFTDGWFLLNSQGQFQELGVTEINGIRMHKWKDTFYNRLSVDNRHRIQVKYERFSNRIYIAVPFSESSDVQETWIYDMNSDRVFIDQYPVTCFGECDIPVRLGLTFDDFAGVVVPPGWESFFTPGGTVPAPPATTMDDMTISGDDMGALFSFDRLLHGNTVGLVYGHTQNFVTRASDTTASATLSSNPPFIARLGVRQRQSSRLLTTVDRVTVEYNTYRPDGAGNQDASVTVFGNADMTSQTRAVDMNKGTTNEIHRDDAWFRFTSPSIGVELSGTNPVALRSMAIDLWQHEVEVRG